MRAEEIFLAYNVRAEEIFLAYNVRDFLAIFLNVICHGVKMGLHFSDPWDKPKAMLKADEPCPYKTGEKSLKAILS